MTEFLPAVSPATPGISFVTTLSFDAASGLGPSPLVSFAQIGPPSQPSFDDYRCPLPPPYRPLPRDAAAGLLPFGLDEALSFVENRYRAAPSESLVLAFLSILREGGWDLGELRARLGADCHDLLTGGAAAAGLSAPPAADPAYRGFVASLNDSFARSRADAAAFDASLYQPVERLLTDRLFRMIREGSGDPVRALMNEAFARHALGDNEAAAIPLHRALDELDRRPLPSSPETLADRITVLHQLASLTDNYFSEKTEWLARAAEDIARLEPLSRETAAILRAENLHLRLQNEPRALAAEASAGLIDKDDVAAVYAARVGALHRAYVAACRTALDAVADPSGKAVMERAFASAVAGQIEHDFGIALAFHLRDEDDEGAPYAEQGERALAGCGVGAVLGAGASLVFGEKITGAAVITGCVAGALGERALYVLQNIDRVGEAYRAGVANITPGEALLSLGEFALTYLSFYAGARLGQLMGRATVSGGAALGRSAGALLTRMGYAPGPWTRGVASFLLRESGHAANAAGFQSAPLAAQALMHPDAEIPVNAETFFGGWLFVRFLPVFVQADPIGTLLPRVPFEASALRAMNASLGIAGLEGARELAAGEDFRRYGDRVAGGVFFALPFLFRSGRASPGPRLN